MNLKSFFYKLSIVICCFENMHTSFGQKNNVSKLSDKLIALEKKFKVSFSYNHTVFDAIFLKEDFSCETIKECIQKIQEQVPITFKNNSTNSYLILPNRKNINLKVSDAEEVLKDIFSLEYQVNNQPKQKVYIKNGTFMLPNIFPLDSIHIHANTYQSIHIKAEDLLKINRLDFSKKIFQLNEVVINSYLIQGINSKISDQSLQINTASLGLLAGETDGDIFNVLKNIPGIHTPSGKPGNLNLRGNTFDQNLLQIDDIPIYHSGHFLGAISPYNPSAISNIEVQRNALPAKWGGSVGGLINMTTYNKIPEDTSYELSTNMLFAGATVKTKLIEDKLALLVAARYSYPSFRSPKLEAISNLIFQGSKLESVASEVNSSSDFNIGFSDINAKLNYKINDKHTTTLSFINIQNNLAAEIEDSENDLVDFRDLELDNWGITAKWKAKFSDKLKTELRVSKSNMNLVSVSEGFLQTERSNLEKYDNTISDTQLITEFVYNYQPDLLFEGGYTLTEHKLISNELEENNDSDTNFDDKRDENAIVHSAFLSLQKNWNDRLTVNLGVRNNYYSPLKELYVNPRLSASYAINNRLFLKSSFGTSNQFIQKKLAYDFDDFNISNQLWYLPNKEISPLKATQFMIGTIYNKSKWLIDFELYHKKTNNITNKADDGKGNIASFGSNLFVKKKWRRLETWMSYSLTKTETDFEDTTDAFFDQRHVLNLTSLLNLNQWKFAISWSYSSGMPIIYSDDNDTSGNENSINLNRFTGSHQLDFSTTYTFYNASRSFKSVIGLSVLNLYNQDNIVNIFQNTSDNEYRKATGFSPNIQINMFF